MGIELSYQNRFIAANGGRISMKRNLLLFMFLLFSTMVMSVYVQAADKIIHDAEYYILEAQNGEKWAADDMVIDKKLAEFFQEKWR
jgi:arylsulfatase